MEKHLHCSMKTLKHANAKVLQECLRHAAKFVSILNVFFGTNLDMKLCVFLPFLCLE